MLDLQGDEADAALDHNVFGIAGELRAVRYVPSDEDRARLHPIVRPQFRGWSYALDEAQTAALVNGFHSRSMDEKWNIWSDVATSDGSTAVHFARSWTGRIILTIELRVAGSTSRVVGVTWETDPTHLKDTSEAFARWTFEGIFPGVFGVAAPSVVI